MENDDVYTGQNQQNEFQSEKIALVALQGVRPEKEYTRGHHHGKTGEHPGFYEGKCLRNGVSLHRSAHQPKIKPDDSAAGEPKSKDVGARDDREHPDRFTK